MTHTSNERATETVLLAGMCARVRETLQRQNLLLLCNERSVLSSVDRLIGSIIILKQLAVFVKGLPLRFDRGCGSPVVKVSNHSRHVMSSIPVSLKTRRVGQRCALNLSRAETSSHWCGVVVRRGGASAGVVHVT
ncbi:uncharacterized protein TNCV_1867931 [Trichonephila clavipes]|nr:uncharacterized protein TNCV_1867931 [Trichonephila clavipes]